jgi:hypothetical protein
MQPSAALIICPVYLSETPLFCGNSAALAGRGSPAARAARTRDSPCTRARRTCAADERCAGASGPSRSEPAEQQPLGARSVTRLARVARCRLPARAMRRRSGDRPSSAAAEPRQRPPHRPAPPSQSHRAAPRALHLTTPPLARTHASAVLSPLALSLNKYVQESLAASDEWRNVSRLADDLLGHLSSEATLARIETANPPDRSSAEVQATFGDFVRELGFESERVGLFDSDEFALRPDYFVRPSSMCVLSSTRFVLGK